MSKLNKELVDKAVETIIQFSNGETIQKEGKDLPGKKRKFTESIELQVCSCAPPSTFPSL